MPLRAQESPTAGEPEQAAPDAPDDAFLDELISSPESAAPAAEPQAAAVPQEPAPVEAAAAPSAAAPAATAAAPAPPQPSVETLPTIPVAAKTEPVPQLKEAPRHAQIEEIVVTATKREQSLREIPASISALSGQDLEKQGAQGVEDIARLVPGVSMTTPGEGNTRVTIRGIAAPAATNPTTGVLFGDVAFSDYYLPLVVLDPNPFDLKSVEVLKGPQGTLFGAGALNGAIRYVPEPPKMGEWETRYFVQYTSIDHGDAAPIYGAAANIPLYDSDKAALRIMGFDRRSPGFLDNTRLRDDANYVDQQGVRAILAWNPAEDLRSTFTYAYQTISSAEANVADNTEGELKTDNRPRHSRYTNDYSFADIKLQWAGLDWAELVSDSSFVNKQNSSFFDASSRVGCCDIQTALQLSQQSAGESDTWSQELRLVSEDGSGSPWRWIAGVFVWKQNIDVWTSIPVTTALPGGLDNLPPVAAALLNVLVPGALGLINDRGEIELAGGTSDIEIQEQAIFGEITREFAQDWELTLGARFFRTKSGGVKNGVGVLSTGGAALVPPSFTANVEEQGINPKVSLLWRANDVVTAYAAAAKGFRVGGLQPGVKVLPGGERPPDAFKSDELWNYETGLRTNWFGGAMHLDVTAYFVDWKNPQTFQNGADGLTVYVTNAGGVQSKGLEAALQTLLPYGFMLGFAGSWSQTETTEEFTASDGDIVPAGHRWPFAPREQYAATLGHSLALGNWEIRSGVTHTYLSQATTDLSDELAQQIFGFHQTDLQFGLANPSLRWLPEINFTVNNLTDERGITNRFDGTTVPYQDVTYIRPRAYTLRLSGSF